MTPTIDADLDTSGWRSVLQSLDTGDEVLVATGGKTIAQGGNPPSRRAKK